MDPFLSFVFRVCLCHTTLSVPCSLVTTCWERADFLAPLYVMVFLWFCTLIIWCPESGVILDLSIPDIYILPYLPIPH